MADSTVDRASLMDVIVGLSHGEFHREASEALAALVKDMNRVADISGGKPSGKLVLTLELKLDRGIFELNPTVKVTAPKSVPARTIMYGTPDGRLTKNDNRQMGLALTGSVRDVGHGQVRDFKAAQAGE